MSDLAIAGILMAFLIGLAITAPIWGVDSRDGIESDQPLRRVAWLHDHHQGQAAGTARRTATVALAGALRTVAYRLDDTAARPSRPDQRLAEPC
jgi:hypothetical protein